MWPMGWMMLGMFLFWGLLIFLAVGVVKLLFQSGRPHLPLSGGSQTPAEILEERYRRGEITQEQYQQMKKDLSG